MTAPRMLKPHRYRIDIVAGALLGIASLLLLRRYWGIDHDAALYLGQALSYRFPEILNQDLFFAYGSQSDFTLFPWLLGQLTHVAGTPSVFLWGTVLCLLLFAWACWYCLSALLADDRRYWAWLGVLCLPTFYGWTGIFGYGEPFLTPRIPSEALCLLAIGLLARGRWTLALGCTLVAMALHPLQVIAALFIVWPWLVLQSRRWLHAAWLAVPICLLAAGGVAPFQYLFHSIDPDWLAELNTYTRQLFIARWTSSDYEVALLDALALGYGWYVLRGKFGSWCMAALLGMGLAFATSLILVDVLELVLPAQLQLWRAHWLAHWFAMATIACLLHRDLQARNYTRALLLALTCTLVWGMSGWLWLVFATLYSMLAWRPDILRPQMARLLGWLFALGILAILGIYTASEWLQFQQAHYRLDVRAVDQMLLRFPAISLGLPLLGVYLWQRAAPKIRPVLLVGLVCPVLAISIVRWDAQPNMLRSVEAAAFTPGLFGPTLPEDAQVFWDKLSVIGPWLVLNRADYYSPQQLSGLVFSRGTAMEARSRLNRLQPLFDDSMRCSDSKLSAQQRATCRVSDESLYQACAPGASRAPDFLVLPYRQAQTPIGTWSSIDPRTGKTAVTYQLYDCRLILQESPQTSAIAAPS